MLVYDRGQGVKAFCPFLFSSEILLMAASRLNFVSMMTVEYWMTFLGVAFISGVADVVWVKYFQTIERKAAVSAAVWGALIYGMSGLTFLSYKAEDSMVIAAMIGGFIGTFLTVKFSKK